MAKKTGLWIPDEILKDNRLTALEKLIVATVMALDKGEGCFASGKYLAEELGCTTDKIYRTVTKGRKIGYFGHKNEYGYTTTNTGHTTIPDMVIQPQHMVIQPYTYGQTTTSDMVIQPYEDDSLHYIKDNIIENIVREDATPPQNVREEFPPGLDTVRAYAREIGAVTEPERFWNYYGSTGWKRGKTPITDWRALFREWDREDRAKSAPTPTSQPNRGGGVPKNNYIERPNSEIDDMWEAALRRSYGDLMD